VQQPEIEPENRPAPKAQPTFVIPPPFPERFAQSKKKKEDKEILEVFRKVEVNIPLLDVIKKIPHYAKLLKEFCSNKKKSISHEKVSLNENVSAVFKKETPPKCADQGMFSIPCKVGNVKIKRAMCDLGASINVMPLSVYHSLNDGPLKKTSTVLQLADRSTVYPEGVLEDVLVKVNDLIFPADFYVLDMGNDNSSKSSQLLLGRPFLSTAKTKIDVFKGKITMEFDNKTIGFNVYDVPENTNEVFSVSSNNINESQIGGGSKKKNKDKHKFIEHPVLKKESQASKRCEVEIHGGTRAQEINQIIPRALEGVT